jgi:hypothetical protein
MQDSVAIYLDGTWQNGFALTHDFIDFRIGNDAVRSCGSDYSTVADSLFIEAY